MSETKKSKSKNELEYENLDLKIKNLEGKVTKPKTGAELYHERVAKYEAAADKRKKMEAQINENRRKLQEQIPKARFEEVKILEAWKRRIETLKETDPNNAIRFQNEYNTRVKLINQDPTR